MNRPWYSHYEKGVPRSIDYPEKPLWVILKDAAQNYPENTALWFEGWQCTYKELYEYSLKFASFLQSLGVQKGDRVALMLPNLPHYPISYYATLMVGGVVVQLNPLYTPSELEFLLNDSETKVLITLDIFWDTVQKVADKVNVEKYIVGKIPDFLPFIKGLLYPLVANPKPKAVPFDGLKFFRFSDFLKHSEPNLPDINPKEDLAVLQYTGGTTGTPKAVMLTHFNILANTYQSVSWFTQLEPGKEVSLCIIPFFHSYGMTVALNFSVKVGAKMVLMPKYHTKDALKLIQKHKVTLLPGVPQIYATISNHPEVSKYNLRSIKACISGAAPLPLKVKEDFERLTGGKLVEGYGLSEASPVTHCNPIYGLNKPGSIGLPFPDTDAKIVDLEDGKREMPVGEAGELIIKGPQVMKGYWKRPDETALVLRDGWLYTGDIAYMDNDGYFYIVDRKKEMIIVGGFNVYPREVEEVLMKHPKVKDAIVVGIEHPIKGEIVKAYVVLKEGMSASSEELINFCKEHLAPYKVPAEIEFRKELPRTVVGKALRRVLKEEEEKRFKPYKDK
ncbi:MAG: long-chain fatty acid--CoA ligase [candidate division WOR-3 bacterium]